MICHSAKRTTFQVQPRKKRDVRDNVNRLRFRFALQHATKVNPRRGAPIASAFHPKFNRDGVYLLSIPAFGVDAVTLFVVRAGTLYGSAVAPIDDPLSLAQMLRDRRITIKRIE